MTTKHDLEGLLREAVTQFIWFPNQLKIKPVDTPNSVILNIQTHRDDMGKLMGAGGVMIKALRLIFESIGDSLQKRVLIEPQEPEFGEKQDQPPYRFNPATKAE